MNCLTVLMDVGSGLPGLNSWATTLVPFGIVRTSTSDCTPNASFIEPESCLNLAASISENASSSTKKHISSVIRSAKVITQAGRLLSGLSVNASIVKFSSRRSSCDVFFLAFRARQVGFKHILYDSRILASLNTEQRIDNQRLVIVFFTASDSELIGYW